LPVHVKIGVRSQESGEERRKKKERKKERKKVFSIDIFYIYT